MSGDTPFARGVLAENVGYEGQGEAVDKMLQGAYTIHKESLDEVQASAEMASFIAVIQTHLSTKTGGPVPVMSDDTIAENYVEMMNKAREATASSPSGIHYGHYEIAL